MDFASNYAFLDGYDSSSSCESVSEDEFEEGLAYAFEKEAMEERAELVRQGSLELNDLDDLDVVEPIPNDYDPGYYKDDIPQQQSSGFSSGFGGLITSIFGGGGPPPPPMPSKSKKSKKKKRPRRRIHKADTNVISVRLGTLKDDVDIMTGDATFCKECNAVFSVHSKLAAMDEDDQVWKCEFCGHKNILFLDESEIPTTETTDYILEVAQQTSSSSGSESNDKSLIFCLDVSGSMISSSNVPMSLKIKGLHEEPVDEELMKLQREFGGGGFNAFQQQERWVSRLQFLVASLITQIDTLLEKEPNTKVGLITFSNDVTIYGDGTATPITVAGDTLYDEVKIVDAVSALDMVNKPISETAEGLKKVLAGLNPNGATALGPALVSALTMVADSSGSKIILCTDGLANIGLGRVDELKDIAAAETFYEDAIGEAAKNQGTTISIISIKDDEGSRIEYIGKAVEISGGDINIVDPLELEKNVAFFIEKDIVATNVEVTLRMHHYLIFRNEGEVKNNTVTRDVGNATTSSDITFEYSVDKEKFKRDQKAEEEAMSSNSSSTTTTTTSTVSNSDPIDEEQAAELKTGNTGAGSSSTGEKKDKATEEEREAARSKLPDTLPFQIQIKFTNLKGDRMIRTITKTQKVTLSRNEAIKEADLGILGLAAVQQAANIASAGDYDRAQEIQLSNVRMMSRQVASKPQMKKKAANVLKNFIGVSENLNSELRSAVKKEKKMKKRVRRNLRAQKKEEEQEIEWSESDSDSEDELFDDDEDLDGAFADAYFAPQEESMAMPQSSLSSAAGNNLFGGFSFASAPQQQQQQQLQSNYRKQTRNDNISNMLYQQKAFSLAALNDDDEDDDDFLE